MSVTNVSHIKPQNNLANTVNRLLDKTPLRNLEQATLGYVVDVISEAKILGSVASLSDKDCERMQLAPVERGRFGDAVKMATKEAGSITFAKLNGHDANGTISIDVDSNKLERAFNLYASGSFRRKELRHKYGHDLEVLLTRNADEQRNDSYNVTIDAQYGEIDGVPQITTYSVHRNADNWITRAISSDIKILVDELNGRLKKLST